MSLLDKQNNQHKYNSMFKTDIPISSLTFVLIMYYFPKVLTFLCGLDVNKAYMVRSRCNSTIHLANVPGMNGCF